MAENWELKSLERRVDSLEKSRESDRERAEDEKSRRQDRWMNIVMVVFWTAYVAAITTFIVLAATGELHRH